MDEKLEITIGSISTAFTEEATFIMYCGDYSDVECTCKWDGISKIFDKTGRCLNA